jgi:hypothetical protein
MSPFKYQAVVPMFAAVSLLAGACSAPTKVEKTFEDPDIADSSFSNFLVIGVAGNYNSRTQFERTMVSKLTSKGASATAHHLVVKGNQPITRDGVTEVLETNEFDAVLLTRVISRELAIDSKSSPASTKVTRKEGGLANFFRYDYEILSEPVTIDLTTTVVLATELYATADEKMIWAIEFTSTGTMVNVGQLIDSVADTIMDGLGKDRLIGP